MWIEINSWDNDPVHIQIKTNYENTKIRAKGH